jgi:hypothetical protein
MSEVQLPERPEPEVCESLSFDAYSGMQMLAYGRVCADAQKLFDEKAGRELKKLGKRLSELLDEDQWAECEALLLSAGVTPNED